MVYLNKFSMEIDAKLENEGFIRSMVAAFCVPLNPSLSEINDIKTAVSEAVTNSIVHGYQKKSGKIYVSVGISKGVVEISIVDNGQGIEDIHRARQPFFTTKSREERSGMGFTLMESFMDELDVSNNDEGGVSVFMRKFIKQ